MAKIKKWKRAPSLPEKQRVSRRGEAKWIGLDPKKHGIGGAVLAPLQYRRQDKKAASDVGYAVIFFPRIKGIGKAHLGLWLRETLSHSPEAAISKFMDRIARSDTWKTYAKAGHRVRKIKMSDGGDAMLGNVIQ